MADADRDLYLFMLATRWPDDIRGNRAYDHPQWHYVNFPIKPLGQPDSVHTKPPAAENILAALDRRDPWQRPGGEGRGAVLGTPPDWLAISYPLFVFVIYRSFAWSRDHSASENTSQSTPFRLRFTSVRSSTPMAAEKTDVADIKNTSLRTLNSPKGRGPRKLRGYFQDACSLSMIAQERLVAACLQLGQTANALKHGGRACFFAGLLRPKVMRVLRSGAAHINLARLYDSMGRAHECVMNLNRSIHAAEQVLHSRRALEAVHRGDLANLFAMSGDLAAKRLGRSTAIQCCRSAVAIWSDIVANNQSAEKPLVVQWLLGISASLNILGHLYEKEGQRTEALELFRQDVEVSKRIADADPTNPQFLANLRLAMQTLERRDV